jgi:hypothetical protein
MNGLSTRISFETAICAASAALVTVLLGILVNAAFHVQAVV